MPGSIICRRNRTRIPLLLLAAALATGGAPLRAQEDSVVVAAGVRYRLSGALRQRLLGRGYRELWATPIRVPVLDLGAFAGGLVPLRGGGHKQTRTLRFRGADGREYVFRSVDKEVTAALPPYLRDTPLDDLYQDQTAALFPAAPLVAGGVLDAAGIPHPEPRLFVLPDDPRLGEFRAEFARTLGTLELHVAPGSTPLAMGGAVVDTDDLLDLLEDDPRHRVDQAAFARARLVDLLLGDPDRHADQWRWVGHEREDAVWWTPVPEDRDHALVHFEGILASAARLAGIRRLVRFEERYPSPLAMTDNSLALSRRLLSDLPPAAWDSVVTALQAELTDRALDEAVARLPRPYAERVGAELTRRLRARRDRLPEAAAALRRVLTTTVEIHATDRDERVEVRRHDDGSVEVRMRAPADAAPYYHRRIPPGTAAEVRIHLHAGNDHAVVEGARGRPVLRVVGGAGDDALVDRSGGPTTFYDHRGENRVEPGPATRVNRRPPLPDAEDDDLLPRSTRDWGRSRKPLAPWADWRPHAELVLGAGPRWTRYGYRYPGYASRIHLRALYAPLHARTGVEVEGDFRRPGSRARVSVEGRVSNLEAISFHGFGNASRYRGSGAARVWHNRWVGQALLHLPVGRSGEVAVGGLVRHTEPSPAAGDHALDAGVPGREPLGQVGARALMQVDTRDSPSFPTRGVRLRVGAAAYPAAWGVDTPYLTGDARLSGNATLPLPGRPVLAARVGGGAALGDFPFFDAAFLGGSGMLRGYSSQRFAGDRAAFAGAELRLPLTEAVLLARGRLGVSLLAEAGRVWMDGESPGGWHTARGAGVWFTTPPGTVALTWARGERDRIYLKLGVPY